MSGLYVHVPFCRKRCVYCDFCSYPDKIGRATEYFNCLKRELSLFYGKGVTFDTVYFGGGTPTVVDAELISNFLDFVRDDFGISENAEITVEGNPDSISPKKVKIFAKCGVNRLSVGLQTADDRTLKILNRPHTLAQFKDAIDFARDAGIENLSADIILGLPNQTFGQLYETLDVISSANLKHVSAYGLTIERGTELARKTKNGIFRPQNGSTEHYALPDADESADFYDRVVERLRAEGFFRYEVSNFSRKGFESRHNLNYWRCGSYIGLGVAAHSYIFSTRRANVRDFDNYIRRISEGHGATSSRRRLTMEEKAYEYIILGLRTEEGINLETLRERFGESAARYEETALRLKRAGLLRGEGDELRVKEDGFYVLNAVLSEF